MQFSKAFKVLEKERFSKLHWKRIRFLFGKILQYHKMDID